jgi:Immunity protein Imm1
MTLRIKIREDAAPLTVEDATQLDEALGQAAEEARKRGMLGAVLIEASNGNVITMVVGGDETVLGFDYGDQNPRYYASRGASDADEPTMTCYLTMQHHTEFPRKYVIPVADGVKAVREFIHSAELPASIKWEEV